MTAQEEEERRQKLISKKKGNSNKTSQKGPGPGGESYDSEDEYQELLPPKKELPAIRSHVNSNQVTVPTSNKMILPMTRQAKPGVPARDRPGRAPPHPREALENSTIKKPQKLVGETDHDENDPVWLKDKGDNFMVNGDYQSAHSAYTQALVDYSNACCFLNRGLAALYLGNLQQCVEDCNHCIRIINMKSQVPAGHCAPPRDPQDERLRVRAFVRRGVAFLWLGDYQKCEESFNAALNDCEDNCKHKGIEVPDYGNGQSILNMNDIDCCDGSQKTVLTSFSEGMTIDEGKQLIEDLNRVRQAAKALEYKISDIDSAMRNVGSQEDLKKYNVIQLYNDCFNLEDQRNAVILANRSYVKLQSNDISGCLEDTKNVQNLLTKWTHLPRSSPKPPTKPQRLDPPLLVDHTFQNPVLASQKNFQAGGVGTSVKPGSKEDTNWLMKHCSEDPSHLPPIPDDFEWIKDASEKPDHKTGKSNAWIAVRKKLTKLQTDSIRSKIHILQEALYSRQLEIIDPAIDVAKQQNLLRDGPCNEAIQQACDFREELQNYLKEEEMKQQEREAKRIQDEKDNEQFFMKSMSLQSLNSMGCFKKNHPVEKTRRRIFVKTKLREAKALMMQTKEDINPNSNSSESNLESQSDVHFLLSNYQKALSDSLQNGVLLVEPKNPDALKMKQELQELIKVKEKERRILDGDDEKERIEREEELKRKGKFSETLSSIKQVEEDKSCMELEGTSEGSASTVDKSSKTSLKADGLTKTKSETVKTASVSTSKAVTSKDYDFDLDDDDDDEDKPTTVSDTKTLIATATKYLESDDSQSAIQIYSYALNKGKFESDLERIRVRLNLCLCLQKSKRVKDLVEECTSALNDIKETNLNINNNSESMNDSEKNQFTRLEAACYTRRGWAFNQLGQDKEAKDDKSKASGLLKSLG